jgi:hypothetical protein
MLNRSTPRLLSTWALALCAVLPALSQAQAARPLSPRQQQERDLRDGCDPKKALAAARALIADPQTLNEPTSLFPIALRLYQSGQQADGLFWFYAGQLRAGYEASARGPEAGQAIGLVAGLFGAQIDAYAYDHADLASSAIDKALAWDLATPNPLAAADAAQDARIHAQVRSSLEKSRQQLTQAPPEQREKLRQTAQAIQERMASTQAQRCGGAATKPQ